MLYEDEIDHSDEKGSLSDPELLEGFEYHPTELELYDYDKSTVNVEEINNPQTVRDRIGTDTVTWLNVSGLKNVSILKSLRDLFEIHPLIIEDLLRPFQRPKVEEYENHLFAILQHTMPDPPHDTEQVSFILGKHYLLTFHESPGDPFDAVRRRIQDGRERLRTNGPDYLMYELLDSVIDSYFPVLERLGDKLERLETQITDNPDSEHVEKLHDQKRLLVGLRRTAWSQREMVNRCQQHDSGLISQKTRPYLRDAADHSIRILDIIEAYREMANSLQDLHMNAVSNRMNEVMKVLTIIATIFIPLTFIAGIYGMNFNPEVSPWNMPELNWYYGYPAVMGIMILIAIVLLAVFRRNNWL